MKRFLRSIIIFIVLTLIVGGITYYFNLNERIEKMISKISISIGTIYVEKPKVKIIDESSKSRPIAVSINNNHAAWPHAGLQDAYMIYEAIIEGGQSRLMALFKGANTAKIGPIRSSRHYFVEFAMEHSAIYAHFGWSPKAEQTIKSNNVNNINGINYDGTKFWREGKGYHTAFTSIANLQDVAKSKRYLMIGSDKPNYTYSAREYNLETEKQVDSINMVYSTKHSVSYKYNEEKKVFYRYQRGNAHTDRVTKEQYFAKNIIVAVMSNYALSDGTNKGRQEVVNEGTGTGYYLTNGKCIDITWKKDSLKSKTYFYDLNGNEITLNDGITFVQIVPKGQKIDVTYKEVQQTNEETTGNVNQ